MEQTITTTQPTASALTPRDRIQRGRVYYVLRVAMFSKDLCRILQSNPQVYYPTYISKHVVNGKIQAYERPKIPGYAFIETDSEREALDFANFYGGIYLASNRETTTGLNRRVYMKVRQAELDRLRQIVDNTDGETMLFDPKDIDLTEGDKIRICSGPFEGHEGFVVSKNGSKNGTVYLQIADGLFANPIEITSESIKVIAFAKQTQHQYQQLHSIRKRIAACMAKYTDGQMLTHKECSALRLFMKRYSELQLDSLKQQKDFLLVKLKINLLLDRDDTRESQQMRDALESISEQIRQRCKSAPSSAKMLLQQRQLDDIRAELASIALAKALRQTSLSKH